MSELGVVQTARELIVRSNPDVIDKVVAEQFKGSPFPTPYDFLVWASLIHQGIYVEKEPQVLPLILSTVSKEIFRLHSTSFVERWIYESSLNQETLVIRTGEMQRGAFFPETIAEYSDPLTTANKIASNNIGFYGAVTQLVGIAAAAGERFEDNLVGKKMRGYATATHIAELFKTPATSGQELLERFQFLFDEGQKGNAYDIILDREFFGKCPAHTRFNLIYYSYGRQLKTPSYQEKFLSRIQLSV